MAGVLDGIRVIDFGQYIAGPLTGMLLADQGADVIRIDPPDGPSWDTPANATWNRGKRSIALDLKKKDDQEIAQQLVDSADVVIENFRPGVMARLGLDAKHMTQRNHQLIYCSLPGFAPNDPRAGVKAWEGIVGAATWTYRPSLSGANPEDPVYTAIPIASSYAAFISSVTIAMALLGRERDGVGQQIIVPLFDAMFPAMGGRVITLHDRKPAPARNPGMGWTRTFKGSDGRWVQYHAGNLRFQQFTEAAGADKWDDPESPAHQEKRMEELFATRTALEWEELATNVGSEAALSRTAAEWMLHPHARESEMIVSVDDPVLGPVLQPGINARLARTPGEIRGPAPTLNAHRDEILDELSSINVAPKQLETPRDMPAILEGIKVLDLCIVLAGPTCGRTMAEFGADVIKIDSPDRERVSFHNEINRAKRSIVLNLKSKEGLEIFWRLVEDADVVVQNFRKDVAERLGVGYEQVRAKKPDIVYASLNTYGQIGPWATRPGHEQIAQAATGMQERFGGDERSYTQPFAVNDYGTGFMGAYAVALALLHRKKTGEGQHVNTALAYTAGTLQSQFLQDYAGKKWTEARGQNARGTGPLNRAYKTADEWIFMSAQAGDQATLATIEGLETIADQDENRLEELLEKCFLSAAAGDWVARLTSHDIGAHHLVTTTAELLENPWNKQHGLSATREHDELGQITTTGPAPRLSRTPVVIGRPAPKPGSDAHDILSDIGMENEFDRLVADNIIRIDGIVPG